MRTNIPRVALVLGCFCATDAFQLPSVPTTSLSSSSSLSVSSGDYLSSLSSSSASMPSSPDPAMRTPPQPIQTTTAPLNVAPPRTPQTPDPGPLEMAFSHAPLSYFSLDKLSPKGPRKNADVGAPHDATRPLVDLGTFSAGSWWCADGGWPSPALRSSTEIFMVLSGHGCVTDLDDKRHFFGPGDTVVLPKGWSGRWDIMEPIHKVWFVYEHDRIEERNKPIRAVVTSFQQLVAPQLQVEQGTRADAKISYGSIYNVGPTQVGCWSCQPGSFQIQRLEKNQGLHVLEGAFFLTDEDGRARRCAAGDMIVLPKGWSGYWDVVETVKVLKVAVQ